MNLSRRTIVFTLFSLFLLSAMAKSLLALIRFALDSDNPASSHIVLVPFVSAALIYLNRKNIFQSVQYSPFPGALAMMAAAALFVGAVTFGAQLPEADRLALATSSFLVMWVGGFLWFYGTAAFRKALFPLLFLAFCIPFPSAVLDGTIAVLQRGSAEVALVLLKMTGTPVYREGFVLAMPNLVVEVAPECSGIRSGISMLILNLLAGNLLLNSWWRRAALVIAAIPIQIFKNAVRIDTISLLTIHVDPGIIDGRLHHDGGIVFFLLGLALVYPILLMLIKSEGKKVGLVPRITG
jgi:exosortase